MSFKIEIPHSYITSKFFSYAENPTQSRNYLNGGCPICNEGKSKGKKKRLFYFPNDEYLYCHNCANSWTPYFWIKQVSGMSFKEIMKEIESYTGHSPLFREIENSENVETQYFDLPALPGECVNLLDATQLKYYSNFFIVDLALKYCNERRLFTALNHPKTFYVCVQDNFHRNRLIIPYYDELGKISCYISRKLLESDIKAKYLIKFNSNKPLFNLEKIDVDFPYIFIFEGPIDAMFVKNGVAISGISMTDEQEHTLNTMFPFHKIIWVFDNYRHEGSEVRDKIKAKLKNNEYVFLYDSDFSEIKDLNEYCMKKNLDFINPDLIVSSSYKGMEGLMRIA